MTPERLEQIRQLFAEACNLAPSERKAFLARSCGSDMELLAEVESLLAESNTTSSSIHGLRIMFKRPTKASTKTNPGGPGPYDPSIPGGHLKGRYRLQSQIGRGGFGVVYLATDEELLSKRVVIKIMLNAAPDAWERRKFRGEIEALARLNHPGIVSISDSGETADGRPFLVMEYVEGESLRSLLRPEGMDLARATDIIRQVGSALDAAHRNGIWHRDLKPENVIVQTLADGEQRTKLIDFGIATVQSPEALLDPTTSHIAGTFRYMAPEQLKGKPSATSDIYALGVIAYEMVTGRTPFNADTALDLYSLQKLGVQVRPSSLRPSLPEGAEQLILQALQFTQSDRPQSVSRFFQELVLALRNNESLPMVQGSEKEPHLGRLVSKMCDRRAQEDEFKGFLMRRTFGNSGLAASCLIHGDEGECHESLVERLAYQAELLARKKEGEERARVKITKIPWQYEGSLEVRLRRLVSWLFERFWAGRELHLEDTSPVALGEMFASSFNSFVFLQHDIRAARWDDLTRSLIVSYLRYLAEIPSAPNRPQVVVFLNVIYQRAPHDDWRRLLLNPKALSRKLTKTRIQRDLAAIHAAYPAQPMEGTYPLLRLDELKPITRDDVLEWFSLHNILETEEQRIRAAARIFTSADTVAPWKSMAEIETHLRHLQRSFLLERGFL